MLKVRFGIVGCGAIYPTHADALLQLEEAQLTAFYDILPERAQAAAEKYRAQAASTWESLLQLVDVVVICVPSGLHAELGIAAARAGKHVVVEKPIDITLNAATRLVEECKANGVKLACISQHRFSNTIRKLRDLVASDQLGKLVQGDAYIKWYRTQQYYDSGDWRGTYALDGGGCLMNQGVHYIDMIQWIMGGVKSVQAVCRTLAHNIEVEDTALALVEYHNGALGVIQGSTCCYPGLSERLEVHGTYGSVIIEGDKPKLWKVDAEMAQKGKYGDGVMQQPTPNWHMHGSEQPEDDETSRWDMQHKLQLQDFAQAVLEDREPYLTGEMALEPLKVVLAIYRSSQSGGSRVELSSL